MEMISFYPLKINIIKLNIPGCTGWCRVSVIEEEWENNDNKTDGKYLTKLNNKNA